MLTDKKLAKIEKELGTDRLDELESTGSEGLRAVVTDASAAIKGAEDELEANPKFQELKESLKALSQGLKDVKKRQKATIAFALHVLEERGEK